MSILNYINAHINNISFPKTIDQLQEFIYKNGYYNVENVINEASSGYIEWTVPRSCCIGDIVLFFHAKTAIQWIRKLETAAKKLDKSSYDTNLIFEWLTRARQLYKLYGGKIFAIGRVSGLPFCDDDLAASYHWSGRIYAKVSGLHLLSSPIDISEFNSFLLISRQSAITPLAAPEFDKLKQIIIDQNPSIPQYFIDSYIGNSKLSKINESNFLDLSTSYRKRFLLESDFRSYYVNHFIKIISNKRTFSECICHSQAHPLARVDNVFTYSGANYLLEVKLNVQLEQHLSLQLDQYLSADYLYMSKSQKVQTYDFEKRYMFVIDVYSVYKYWGDSKKLVKLFDLDDIKTKSDILSKMEKHFN